MKKTVQFLDPSVRLVDAVAEQLLDRVLTDGAGARSLAHVLVVVPTAQSGRSLRLRLAERAEARFGAGILPPRVAEPMALVDVPEDGFAKASSVQLRAAFLAFVAERPRRHAEAGRLVLDEWQTLFSADYVTDVTAHLAFFDQLADIWRILAGRGLLMADVPNEPAARALLAEAPGDEAARWDDLAAFETAFFAFLRSHGLRHEAEAIRLAKTRAKPLAPEIREVILPALADPVSVLYDVLEQQRDTLAVTVFLHARPQDAGRFDAWGRPTAEAWTGACAPHLTALRAEDIFCAGRDAALADRLARDFPPVDADRALPALGLCDADLFPELAAAFLNAGYELHNPERHALSVSSLGHLAAALVTVYAERRKGIPWETFATLVRLSDVLAVLLRATPKDEAGNPPVRADVLHGLDVCRNAFLPQTVPASAAFDGTFDAQRLAHFDREPFAAFRRVALTLLGRCENVARETGSPAAFLRQMLVWIYGSRRIAERDGEFRSAAEALRKVLEDFENETVRRMTLSEGAAIGLLRKTLHETSYSLEPDSPNAVRTEGWLELVWSRADKVALAGFHEGAVPDAVTGHAFLPDGLRAALGLTSNARRLARDTYLLSDLLASRAAEPGAVRAYVSRTNAAGDIRRPSRLLFLVPPADLPDRAKALFGDLPPEEPAPARALADAWRPNLPDACPVPRTSDRYPEGLFSASMIDTWLKCPFTYLFAYGLDMRRVKEKTELEANDFGTLLHRALELYAGEQLDRTAKGLAQLHDARDIAQAFDAIMDRLAAGYGEHPSVGLRLQIQAARDRLRAFAGVQAAWAGDGWNVAEKPEYRFEVRPFAGEGAADVTVKGTVDRIDFKEGVGYRLIDYKTWDKRAGAMGRILNGSREQLEHAARLVLPVTHPGEDEKKRRRFLSVQLPLYGRCLEKADPATFAGRIADYCYALLGASPADVVVLGSAYDQGPFEAVKSGKVALAEHAACALETARVAIRRIRENFFWPPGPSEAWKYDFKDLLSVSPACDFPVGTPWRDRQEGKLAELRAAEGLTPDRTVSE